MLSPQNPFVKRLDFRGSFAFRLIFLDAATVVPCAGISRTQIETNWRNGHTLRDNCPRFLAHAPARRYLIEYNRRTLTVGIDDKSNRILNGVKVSGGGAAGD